jgi:hypothetical protein
VVGDGALDCAGVVIGVENSEGATVEPDMLPWRSEGGTDDSPTVARVSFIMMPFDNPAPIAPGSADE